MFNSYQHKGKKQSRNGSEQENWLNQTLKEAGYEDPFAQQDECMNFIIGNPLAECEEWEKDYFAGKSGQQEKPLLISDNQTAQEGQMGKSEFLDLLESEILNNLSAQFDGSGFSEKNCPWLKHIFRHYRLRGAAYLEKSLINYLGEKASTAEGYIQPALSRVSDSVKIWMETGEITGVPVEIPKGFLKYAERDAASFRARMGKGKEIDPGVKSRMENALGTSLGDVKIHTDEHAAKFAEEMDAKAVTMGEDIAFASNMYQPGTTEGDILLAHELMHTLQQQDAAAGGGMVEEESEAMEQHAELSLWQIMQGKFEQIQAAIKGGLSLQRCSSDREFKTPQELLLEQQEVILKDKDNYEKWKVTTSLSKKAEELAKYYKKETKKRAQNDLENGSPNNKNRWVRLYPYEVEDAIMALNAWDREQFEKDHTGKEILIPTIEYWDGKELVYYTGLGKKEIKIRKEVESVSNEANEIEQELTIEEAREQKVQLPEGEALEQTRDHIPEEKSNVPHENIELARWMVSKLGKFQNQMRTSASKNNIPLQLLAVIILNELADIGYEDKLGGESVGIGQITIETVKKYNLLDYKKEQEIEKLLEIPQYSIEAAAKRIAQLLNEMGNNKNKPWQKQFNFKANGPMGNNIYYFLNGTEGNSKVEKIGALANMIAAAYNSPEIIITQTLKLYEKNAIVHGKNAEQYAKRMYIYNLFQE